MAVILLVCLAALVALGLAERLSLGRARRVVTIRVHVNGTRGKSTVTRLIAAALREAGVPTVAKVTGTAPRLILPGGSELPVVRRAPASIREQSWALRRAARLRARALVVECMAVSPDLQWVSERDQLRSTLGVITNVRLDHTEAMGETLHDIARSLSNTIPSGGTLVVGDGRFRDVFAARCAQLGTKLVVASGGARQDLDNHRAEMSRAFSPDPMTLAVALAATRELGIDDETALKGMRGATPDPGAVARGSVVVAGRSVEWVDATAVNDPESLDLVVQGDGADGEDPAAASRSTICAYNHRADRSPRLATFAAASDLFRHAASIVLTGERPARSLLADTRRHCPGVDVRYVKRRHLASTLAAGVKARSATRIVYCGNTRGFVRPSFDVRS